MINYWKYNNNPKQSKIYQLLKNLKIFKKILEEAYKKIIYKISNYLDQQEKLVIQEEEEVVLIDQLSLLLIQMIGIHSKK